MYPGTDYYGIGKILLEYAGLPRFLPFPYAVQHGWQEFPTRFEVDSKPSATLVWSNRIKEKYRLLDDKACFICIGSFYLYLPTDFLKSGYGTKASATEDQEKQGSVIVVPHSSEYATTLFSFKALKKFIDELPPRYRPVTLMVYHKDLTKEFTDFFGDFKIFSNGTIGDQHFLHNFRKNIKHFKFLLSDTINTATIFAAYEGLEINFFELQTFVDSSNYYILNKGELKKSEFLINLERNFNLDLVNAELGRDYKLTEKELRRLILKGYFKLNFIKLFIYKITLKFRYPGKLSYE